MENKDFSSTENILVKVDENNLIYLDPNTVIVDGQIQPRLVNHENLVMYVNLEADLVPRSRLSINNNTNTLESIAKGTFNMLRSQSNVDKELSSDWTESYTPKNDNINISDETGQSFGISNISIMVKGANFIPQVDITFIDVRGKTLFESPENSPYRAFFHIPWPIFYLSVKGFYGKAIRYRLHLVKLNTIYNESNGNFETHAKFVGSTFAFMNDIPLKGILNAPYMYMTRTTGEEQINEETNVIDVKVFKSSKGYAILKSVYDEMKVKKYIPQNFPVITLRELGHIAGRLDAILEKKISNEVADPKLISAMKEYGKAISEFKTGVNAWRITNLSNTNFVEKNNETYYFTKNKDVKITGQNINGSLEIFISRFNLSQEITVDYFNTLAKNNKDFDIKLFVNKIKPITDYYFEQPNKAVAIDKLLKDIDDIEKNFIEQDNHFNTLIEEKINVLVRDPLNGFGFDPTVRNLFAVVLANAEVYIRLMKDVHDRAFAVGNERKDKISGFQDETIGEPIYPWPEIKKQTPDAKDKIIAYPGDLDLRQSLGSGDPNLWPEVDFVEEFLAISTNLKDNLVEKEGGVNDINYIFVNDEENAIINDVSSLFLTTESQAYLNRTVTSFIYEIYERAKTLTLVDSFSNDALLNLSGVEFETIKEVLANENDIKKVLKDQIRSIDDLTNMMFEVSPYERYEYFKDKLSTTEYIKNFSLRSFIIEQYDNSLNLKKDLKLYDGLNNFIRNYKPESYRTSIYPFNSDLYLSYINKTNTTSELDLNGAISLNQSQGYLTSKFDALQWIKDDFSFFTKETNLFTQKFKVSETLSTNILNTPYFHKQLYSDYNQGSPYGKFKGSAYLLVNSLPFYDLSDIIPLKNNENGTSRVRMSTLFKEVGAAHFLPYLMVVKWGAIYHRYRKYIEDGEDILNGFLTSNTNTTTTNINGNLFFNNNETSSEFTGFTANSTLATYSEGKDVGIHPYYDSIFHEVVNGYKHYDVDEGNLSFSGKTANGSIIYDIKDYGNNRLWSGIVDNSKYDDGDFYTLLPSNGNNKNANRKINISLNALIPNTVILNNDSFEGKVQTTFRVVWDDEFITSDFSGKTFSSPKEYQTTYNEEQKSLKEFSIGENYRKVIDLIGTFSPSILEKFETIFLNFASEDLNVEIPQDEFSKVVYFKFQRILRKIVNIDKNITYTTNEELFNKLKEKQKENLLVLSDEILFHTEFLKFTNGNPKELDSYIFESFYNQTGLTFNSYNVSQLSNQKYIDLYVGENPDNASNYYLDFFTVNDIELSQENVLILRPLILMYAGYRKQGLTNTSSAFRSYIQTQIFDKRTEVENIAGANNRLAYFLNRLITNFATLETKEFTNNLRYVGGYNIDPLKLETYNFLKSFNDKWSAGISIGQRLLMDEFLFLDKANVDIGDKVYLNVDRFISILSEKNEKANLYSTISMLIQNTGFDMRPLPAYVNFYSPSINSGKLRFEPSKNTAANIFGTFLEVDYQESSPKIIIQYIGQSSKRPADLNPKESRFADDSFNVGNRQNNPLIVTLPEVFRDEALSKSNKVVAFEVNVGDQYQGIFKSVKLDQATIKNTSESFVVTENIARSESGSGAYNIDIALFEYYRQASYQCEVTCMGNVMIQPTMFFYLNNIPMFRGTYWITEVSHSIKDNAIQTTFKGSRIPKASLPNPSDSFLSSYRPLLDKVINNALQVARTVPATESTEIAITDGKTGERFIVNPGEKTIPGETLLLNESGLINNIAFNGYKGSSYIQRVNYKNEKWFRAYVVRMDGPQYNISPSTVMSIISDFREPSNLGNPPKITWSMIETLSNKQSFYSTYFIFENNIAPDSLIGKQTILMNPKDDDKKVFLNHQYSLDSETGINIKGPINAGPPLRTKAGIAMSYKLMKELNLQDNDLVYFKIL